MSDSNHDPSLGVFGAAARAGDYVEEDTIQVERLRERGLMTPDQERIPPAPVSLSYVEEEVVAPVIDELPPIPPAPPSAPAPEPAESNLCGPRS